MGRGCLPFLWGSQLTATEGNLVNIEALLSKDWCLEAVQISVTQSVVYFDLRLGAEHRKRWSKYAIFILSTFLQFFAHFQLQKTSKKKGKKGKRGLLPKAGLHPNAGLAPFKSN